MLEVHESGLEMADVERTADATRLPSGSEHEMFDEQLATAVEEIGQRLRTVRALEDVVLFDANPGQIAPPGVDLVPQPGEFFLLLQEFRAGNEPLVAGNNRVMFEAFGGGVDDRGVLLLVSATSGIISRMGCVIWNSMTRRTRGDVHDNFLPGNRDRPQASN